MLIRAGLCQSVTCILTAQKPASLRTVVVILWYVCTSIYTRLGCSKVNLTVFRLHAWSIIMFESVFTRYVALDIVIFGLLLTRHRSWLASASTSSARKRNHIPNTLGSHAYMLLMMWEFEFGEWSMKKLSLTFAVVFLGTYENYS